MSALAIAALVVIAALAGYASYLWARVWLYQRFQRQLQQQQSAEDAVMEIYEELTDKCLKHEIDNFKSWLYSVSKNYCLQRIRSSCRVCISSSPPTRV